MTVIGAHWDTVPGSPGVGDNGSGLAALLEVTVIVIIIVIILVIVHLATTFTVTLFDLEFEASKLNKYDQNVINYDELK